MTPARLTLGAAAWCCARPEGCASGHIAETRHDRRIRWSDWRRSSVARGPTERDKSYTPQLLDAGRSVAPRSSARRPPKPSSPRWATNDGRAEGGSGRPALSSARAAGSPRGRLRRCAGQSRGRMGTSGLEEKAARTGDAVVKRAQARRQSPIRPRRSKPAPKICSSRPTACSPRGVGQAARRHADDAGAARAGAALRPHRGASSSEVEQIYLPMSRLLNLYVAAAQELHAVSSEFLGRKDEGALHHRHRRLGGGRQEHDRPRAESAAGALAGPSARRPHHHRRLPLSQRGAGAARADGPQGLPRELRHGAPAELPARREIAA